jgi:phytanoyl-CoA dioxygenase PhyH
VDELTDSSGIAGEADALRQRLAADGYLYFRNLLSADAVAAAGAAVSAQLRAGGWIDSQGSPAGPPRVPGVKAALTDPAFRRALAAPRFNQLPYLPPLRLLVRQLLGPRAFSYPAKVLRAVAPETASTRTRGRYAHHDYGVAGVQDMLTSWLPVMEVPASLGGLAVRPGGHLERPKPPWVLRPAQRGWASTDYRPGDVIIFHCLTPHAALPNTTGRLRLSGDFRWQCADQPAPAELVLGPAGRGPELFSRLFRHEPWWEPVPPGLRLVPRAQLVAAPPSPSQFFPMHPAWQRWQPPSAAVH